jgi:Ca-activated chloride channel family protein
MDGKRTSPPVDTNGVSGEQVQAILRHMAKERTVDGAAAGHRSRARTTLLTPEQPPVAPPETQAPQKPPIAPALPLDREPELRAYAYYRALDPALTYDAFRVRMLPVPPPAVGDEGLGQEEFRRRYGSNPFVDARRDRFSTFGMEVDTASYTLARTTLRSGKLPEQGTVRVEEFVNYFKEPCAADPTAVFSVFCEGGPSPFGRALELLKIAVKARELGPGERANAVLTLVIDTSGSMAATAREIPGGPPVAAGVSDATRLELVRESLHTLLAALGPDDRVGIVAYATHPTLLLPHAPARERGRIAGAIDALGAGGATNVEAGLDFAYRLADEVFEPKALNRVILCSDGVANVGARGPEEILRKVEVFARRGIFLSVIGFGMGKYNDAMLETLANKGNGTYAYVDAPAEAERIFRDNLPATLAVLAQDAKIQVDFDPDVVTHYRLLGYENRDIRDQDFRNDAVDAGEVGPGSQVTALYEIRRAPNAHGDLGLIYLRYRNVGTGRVEEANYPLRSGVIATSLADTTDRFRFTACAAETAELLRRSYWSRDGSFAQVLKVLRGLSPAFRQTPECQDLVELSERAQALTVELLGRPAFP